MVHGEADDGWIEGVALDDPTLAEGVLDLWRRAAHLAGEAGDDRPVPRDVRTASALLDEASDRVVAALEAGERKASPRMLVAVGAMQGDVREFRTQARGRGLARVQAALGRLRGVGSVDQLMDLGPSELCRCGFDRVMITQIQGSRAVPQLVHVPADPDWALELQEAAKTMRIELDHTTPETEMLRRPGPLLVADARHDPRVVPAMRELTGTRSYVAAPIMPEGKVMGFLHADCLVTQRTMDEFDRDLLWTFAQGFGYAWERAVLLERLRTLRQDVRRGHASVLTVMDEFSRAGVEITRVDPGDHAVMSSAAAMFVAADQAVESLLTKRELEVVALMAAGHSNTAIAEQLFVSEGTVKSHVKHILRKLRAKNRAEAVSRYMRLARRESIA
jgi:DNA-binding CsgD family transcriptional regulator